MDCVSYNVKGGSTRLVYSTGGIFLVNGTADAEGGLKVPAQCAATSQGVEVGQAPAGFSYITRYFLLLQPASINVG